MESGVARSKNTDMGYTFVCPNSHGHGRASRLGADYTQGTRSGPLLCVRGAPTAMMSLWRAVLLSNASGR